MILKELIHWKKRAFIYSLILSIGFIILLYVLENEQPNLYPYLVFVLSLIFILELVSTIYLGKKSLKQFGLPEIIVKDKYANIVQHIILPISLFISLVSFVFFHKYLIIKGVFIIIGFILFWILFSNIRAYYEDKFKIELRTHYIYDIISVISFFGLFESLLNISVYFGLNNILTGFYICLLILLFMGIVIIRLYHYDLLKFILPILLMNLGIYILGKSFGLVSLRIAFLDTITYYFFIAFAHHHKEGTKSLKVLEEYLILLLIALVLLIFN